MFWGCFSYEEKGPCHIWQKETAAEADIAERNEAAEPALRAVWELEIGMRRAGLRNKPGKKPEWRFTKANGKLVREGVGGIDWYRYQHVFIIGEIIPFAKICAIARPRTIFQDDKAPAHAHRDQQRVYDLNRVGRMISCGNSPDLNATEPAWPYLKRATTAKGAPRTKETAARRWREAWKDLPQPKIREWIERIPLHIQ